MLYRLQWHSSSVYSIIKFSYGQTSAGKTYTMEGVNDPNEPSKLGIIPRISEDLKRNIELNDYSQVEMIVKLNYKKVSMVEIYNESIDDLLDIKNTNLTVMDKKQEGVFIKDLKKVIIKDPDEILHYFRKGTKNR